jgi:hypothetical protein
VAPAAGLDKVSNAQVIISATWEPAGMDTIRGTGFTDTFQNSGTAADLTAPLASLAAPDGGEAWTVGSSQSILWNASDATGVTAVDLGWSETGVAPWSPIATGIPNTGSFAWTVPAQPTANARVRVVARDAAGNAGADSSLAPFQIIEIGPVAVGDEIAAALGLAPPVPNPSQGTASLRFSLPREGLARLEIMDLAGRRVWQAEAVTPAGRHTLAWDGQAGDGGRPGAGLYFVRLTTPWGTRTQRMVRLR